MQRIVRSGTFGGAESGVDADKDAAKRSGKSDRSDGKGVDGSTSKNAGQGEG